MISTLPQPGDGSQSEEERTLEETPAACRGFLVPLNNAATWGSPQASAAFPITGRKGWRKELLRVMRDILDCEPVMAMDRIDRMLDEQEEPEHRH